MSLQLERYSIGIGDRFGRQGKAQLSALAQARKAGVQVTPVWNKSNREHQIIGTRPDDVRREADDSVRALAWTNPYRVDADHISLKTVDAFLKAADFFTLDVADFSGKSAPEADIRGFVERHRPFVKTLRIPGIPRPLPISEADIDSAARKYLLAVREAGTLYRHIEAAKGPGTFITEVSMDETDRPQTPLELLFILAAMAEERIPAQTVAPKFTGRFNKGVDYVGDLARFEQEFRDDIGVIAFAVREFGLPANLKLSVHSGSDKFSLYGPMRKALRDFNAGLHLKTAGTTWLEEIIGLAAAGGNGLEIARAVYAGALERFDEMCKPYATVIDIDPKRLPSVDALRRWSGQELADAVRHDPANPRFNPHIRQLLHVGYKVAAEMGPRYLAAVEQHESVIAKGVAENLFERHLRPLFVG